MEKGELRAYPSSESNQPAFLINGTKRKGNSRGRPLPWYRLYYFVGEPNAGDVKGESFWWETLQEHQAPPSNESIPGGDIALDEPRK